MGLNTAPPEFYDPEADDRNARWVAKQARGTPWQLPGAAEQRCMRGVQGKERHALGACAWPLAA